MIRRPIAAALATAFASGAFAQTGPLPTGGNVVSGSATIQTQNALMRIMQQSQRVAIDWQTFNIFPGHTVRFEQPGASATALNRVLGNERSLIQGLLEANGQVYILNHNGILFDRGSQVNVHTLLASTLNMNVVIYNDLGLTETRSFFLTGDKPLRANEVSQRQPHFSGFVNGADGKPASIELKGTINAKGGAVLVFAPRIAQEGTISAPDGQIMLAAGEKVWLTRPLDTDTALRGYIVEFRADAATNLNNVIERSAVVNSGTLRADRGNVTLAALAVNHSGSATASSAAFLNGSVYLLAAEGAGDNSGGRRRGTVTLAPGSVVATPLDTADRST